MIIKSADNKQIKEYKALQSKKFRDESNCYIIEGEKIVEEALAKHIKIKRLFVSADYDEKNKNNKIYADAQCFAGDTIIVDTGLFQRISDTKSPQGIAAIVEKPGVDLSFLEDSSMVIIMENVQDPGNMGTLIRTSSAVGADALMLCNDCVDPYNPKVVRSAMGTMFNSRIMVLEDIADVIEMLRKADFKVYAAHLKGEMSCFDVMFDEKTAIILGNESKGMTNRAAGLADELIKIPMENSTESLNVGVAGSILMYEIYRRKL